MLKFLLNWDKFNLLIFPIIIIIGGTIIIHENFNLFQDDTAVMFTYLDNAAQGDIGYGFEIEYNNDISFAGLEAGDILVGGYPGCAYGRFSHAGIYIGNGQVVEALVDTGVHIRSVDHFRDYTEIALLRVNIDPQIKKKAVEYVKNNQGAMFYSLAFKPGDRIFNCSKIIWKAYAEQGYDLDSSQDLWISPDVFYNSSQVSIIREKGR